MRIPVPRNGSEGEKRHNRGGGQLCCLDTVLNYASLDDGHRRASDYYYPSNRQPSKRKLPIQRSDKLKEVPVPSDRTVSKER